MPFFKPCDPAPKVRAAHAQSALQREVVMSSGNEMLFTEGLRSCNALFLAGEKSGVRMVAHFDLMHQGEAPDVQIIKDRVDDLMRGFFPDETVHAYILRGNWESVRADLLQERKITENAAWHDFTRDLERLMTTELETHLNVIMEGSEEIKPHSSGYNYCGIDRSGTLYQGEIRSVPVVSQSRRVYQNQKIQEDIDPNLSIMFDGRTKKLKDAISAAWDEKDRQSGKPPPRDAVVDLPENELVQRNLELAKELFSHSQHPVLRCVSKRKHGISKDGNHYIYEANISYDPSDGLSDNERFAVRDLDRLVTIGQWAEQRFDDAATVDIMTESNQDEYPYFTSMRLDLRKPECYAALHKEVSRLPKQIAKSVFRA